MTSRVYLQLDAKRDILFGDVRFRKREGKRLGALPPGRRLVPGAHLPFRSPEDIRPREGKAYRFALQSRGFVARSVTIYWGPERGRDRLWAFATLPC